MYKSEYKEDLFIDKMMQGKQGGFFVDVGAYDGINFSNTWFFEKVRGWNGICLEPNPELYAKLLKSRWCKCYPLAAAPTTGDLEFTKVDGVLDGWSGLTEWYDPKHLDRLKKRAPSAKIETVQVPCQNLNELLEQNGVTQVDYLSIDTEGSEYAILKDFDFEKVRVDLITVENNYDRDPIREMLKEKGFDFKVSLEVSEVYARG